jgi:SAM-dependent methyltransferase
LSKNWQLFQWFKRLSQLFKDIKNKYSEDYHSHLRADLITLVEGEPKSILDIGCAKGLTGRYFKERFRAQRVVGVEKNLDAAEEAKKNLDEVHILDLNYQPLPVEDHHFDLIILGDILEHLIDPEKLLKEVYSKLAPDGQVIISLPNIRNWRVLCELVFKGDWRYREKGILDKTHLKFFTLKSARRMIEEADFKIIRQHGRLRYPEKILNILTLNLFRNFLLNQHYFLLKK